jgi:hypothetical protein
VACSTEAIHDGCCGSSPFFGRFDHCFAAITSKAAPTTILSTETMVEASLSLSSPTLPSSTTTTALTAMSPRTQPNAKSGPSVRAFGVLSTITMAMIGNGLSATARAAGTMSPSA